MNNAVHNFTHEIRSSLESEAMALSTLIANLRIVAAGIPALEAEGKDAVISGMAMVDDPTPTAALLLRVSRLRREAADASDELRRALVAAVGWIERKKGEGEQ